MVPEAQSFLVPHTETFLFFLITATGLLFLVMRRWFSSALLRLQHFVQGKKVWAPLCVVLLGGYLLILVCNTLYPGYLEHVEPNIASVSFILLKGAPLYHDLASTQRYAFPYGPMAYLPYTVALGTLGANVLSLKLVVLLALACGLSFDIKFTAPFYFAPLFVLLIGRHGWRPAALASAGAVVLAVV